MPQRDAWRLMAADGTLALRAPLGILLQQPLALLRLVQLDGCTQRLQGRRHLLRQDDAPGSGLLTDDLQHQPPVGLKHDDIARIFGFESVQHWHLLEPDYLLPLAAAL